MIAIKMMRKPYTMIKGKIEKDLVHLCYDISNVVRGHIVTQGFECFPKLLCRYISAPILIQRLSNGGWLFQIRGDKNHKFFFDAGA